MSSNLGNATLRHISIRVPWHDNAWNGSVCDAPKLNGACLKLRNIAQNKNEATETAIAGKSIQDLAPQQWPPCVSERATFMAPFEFAKPAKHPYAETSAKTHGHFLPTPLRHPAYAAPAIPFRWMLTTEIERHQETYAIAHDPDREPELPFKTTWLQDYKNQQAALDAFYEPIHPETSLCFFYAKQVPFIEDTGGIRVLIGVGRVKHIGPCTEYKYSDQGNGKLRSMLWERMVSHSIRPEFEDGFLLPYHAALTKSEQDPSFDPATIVAYAPSDRMEEFSYATEHVTHDGAIAALLACAVSLRKSIEAHLPGPWESCLKWIDERLAELWKMRGPCPGLGAVLCALGLDLGTFIAREVAAKLGDNEDPWPLVDRLFTEPKAHLSKDLADQISPLLQKTWQRFPKERKALLQLLSRFAITPDQAKILWVDQERKKAGIECTDTQLLQNPYLIFEKTFHTTDPISIWTVDRGVFPELAIRTKHPLPAPSALANSGLDERRIRAFSLSILETAASDGNTLLSQDTVITQIRDLPIQPTCEVTSDSMLVAEDTFIDTIDLTLFKNGTKAYQLTRLAEMGQVIRQAVNKRTKGRRHEIAANWEKCLEVYLNSPTQDESEKSARLEKAAALKELAESRFAVLIGQAGTGKTTLLSVLCNQPNIEAGGVLLLAPTGKASVKMAQSTKIKAYTIAQFLNGCDRYDPQTARYRLSSQPAMDTADTVIVDEASMLTEEMLAALLDALKGVKRLILVGDPRQLPPIGPGRPFVDIVNLLQPDDVETRFPCVAPGYTELTILRRQQGTNRADLQLASWFSGRSLSPGEDDVFETVTKPDAADFIRFESWETPEEFNEKLIQILVEELNLNGPEDSLNFDIQLGGQESNGYAYFNRGSAAAVENWQILSPVRGQVHGVTDINRLIHKTFKAKAIEMAQAKFRKTPKPMGEEQIVYGDKVINSYNHRRYNVYPKESSQRAYPGDEGVQFPIKKGQAIIDLSHKKLVS
jgi:AAA domain